MKNIFLYSLFFCGVSLIDARCGELYVASVSLSDRIAILSKHIKLRSLITLGKLLGQPKGYNLKLLLWDDKLAAAAQHAANSCDRGLQKATTDSRFPVGQNIFHSSSTAYYKGADWDHVIQEWFDQNKKFQFTKQFKFQPNTDSYSQIAWADTKYIGCGYAHYHGSAQWKYEKFYICLYGPAGNIPGGQIYKTLF